MRWRHGGALAAVMCALACGGAGGIAGDSDLPGAEVPPDAAQDVAPDVAPDTAPDAEPKDAPEESTAEEAVTKPFPEDVAAALQVVLEEYLHFSSDPGVAFAIHPGDGSRWSSFAGLADVRSGRAVDADSLFRVGSNTKPIVATWILQLVEEGQIDLDAPLTTWLPEYVQWSDTTVRHLLGMQSGIPEYISDVAVLAKVLTDPGHVWTPAEVIGAVEKKPRLFAPGTAGAYSNSNYILLGMIGERVTGRSAADELRDRFFEPLGMTATRLELPGDPTDRLVHGYMDLAILVPLMKLPPAMFAAIPAELYIEGTDTVDATTLLHPSLTWTAGAVVSRPDDLAVFHRALQKGQLLAPDLLAEMRSWHPVALLGGVVDYGLGLMRYRTAMGDVFGHGGLNFGFHVETFFQPDLGLAFCHMHNFLPAQTVAVTEEALSVAMPGAGEGLPACTVPEEFLAGGLDGGAGVRLRFKGVVGEKGKPATLHAGMASADGVLGGESFRLYGIDRLGIYAGAVVSTGLAGRRLEVTAWGANSDGTLRSLLLSLDPDILAKAGPAGTVGLGKADLYAAGAVLIDIELGADSKPKRHCVVAVPDYARASGLYACDGDLSGTEAGEMLRIGAVLALTPDEAAVDAYMLPLGVPRCMCYDGAGVPGDCP